MPTRRPGRVSSPQKWRKKNVRNTPRRREQRTANSIRRTVRRETKRVWLHKLLKLGGVAIIVGLIFGTILVAWYSRDLPKPGEIIERDIPVSTKIYDRTGETILYEVFSDEKRTPIQLEDLPNHVLWSSITAEDRSFYSHRGIKITGIIRSVIVNTLKGRKAQGGSTITQQLIKNAFLSPEKKYSRKLKEVILAWQLERKFTKDEILELYYNEIPYGSTAYGIESAAQAYFGKHAKELTMAESAILAAMSKAPTYYSPYGSHQDELIFRQQLILDGMVDEGYISEEEAENAKAEELEFKPFTNSIIAPHFVFHVREQLSAEFGERILEQGGLKVITTLDLFKQNIAQEIIDERAETNENVYGATNAAFVALDPKNGEILSMIGSRDFFNKDIDGEVNVVTRPRQPGSSFKPMVYAAAFEQGFTPDTIMFDVNTTFKTEIDEDYEPKNYNLAENGPVSIRDSLGSSLNITAVKTIYLTGVSNVLDLADKLHYSTLGDRSRFGLSLVLGGAEVTLLEHAAAYGAFAREGIYHKPIAILKIEDVNGKVLHEIKPRDIKDEKVMEPQIAKLVNSILTDNNARLLTFGENNYLTLGARPAGAKTGTTNDQRDAWTMGYTPSLVAGVWVGNNDNSAMGEKAAGGSVAAPIWNAFMRRVLGDTPIETFHEPDEYINPDKPLFNGEHGAKEVVVINKQTGKRASEHTPTHLREEKTFMQIHNILHYANRYNVLGPIPESPWDDPNYTAWEIPVEEWAKENDIVIGTPPTEVDDQYRPEDQPVLSVHTPQSGAVISGSVLNVTLTANIPRGASRIEYRIGETLIKSEPLQHQQTISQHSTSINLSPTIENGLRTLSVALFDDLDNDAVTTIPLNINR